MSTNRRIYLDFNATSPLSEVAAAAMGVLAGGVLGNPSSIHQEGRGARDLVERARDVVARLVGRAREHVVFTSGGTEANRLGIEILVGGRDVTVEVGGMEHPSLTGRRAGTGRAVVVGVGAVNHELGTIADLDAIVAEAHARGALVHVDAVQATGKLDLAPIAAIADTMAISAHKIGGPQGVGALVIADPDRVPVREDGHQERGRRGGTENVVGIVGFGAAAAAVDVADWARVRALGERFEAAILAAVAGTRVHGADRPRVGGVVNVGFAGARGDAVVIALDLAGVAASTGSACTSGSVEPSTVLLALGEPPERAREAVRFSLGRTTTADELDSVVAMLPAIVARARR